MKLSFGKNEKLKSEKEISLLFEKGKSVAVYPLRLIYLSTETDGAPKTKAGVSVSKRLFKRAVDRNRIKRLMREAYRLQKQPVFSNFSSSCTLMILYIGKDTTDFETIKLKMLQLLEKFAKKVSKPNT